MAGGDACDLIKDTWKQLGYCELRLCVNLLRAGYLTWDLISHQRTTGYAILSHTIHIKLCIFQQRNAFSDGPIKKLWSYKQVG